ncbi:MAG: hypothetical protein J07HQW2_03448 [Haloquadratum walsbyi J07HQW2]|uniref:Uncharacterized protein n=1 Tax=Haloquadratum walsbyi J07HQW2 TaxID=1238425 RepID=U1PT51_9EURY|nr:MAG: hypothetical protein J07HQW2_03448 [Haloquadratum walsbyi J07HQW2]
MIKFDYLIITHFLALFFSAVWTLVFISGVRYKRDYHRLKTERNTEQDELLTYCDIKPHIPDAIQYRAHIGAGI